VGKAAAAPEQVITIEIDKQLHILVKSKSTAANKTTQIKQDATMDNVAKIALQLQSGVSTTPVIISADKGITYDNVVKVMDRLQKAGVQRVGLAVRQGE
jgi:biopolymer transport protein TolR